jgi:hypothetical protein
MEEQLTQNAKKRNIKIVAAVGVAGVILTATIVTVIILSRKKTTGASSSSSSSDPISSGFPADGSSYIFTDEHGKTLSFSGTSLVSNTTESLWQLTEWTEQTSTSGKYYTIRRPASTAATATSETAVSLATLTSADEQIWEFIKVTGETDTFRIRNFAYNNYLSANSSGTVSMTGDGSAISAPPTTNVKWVIST